LNELGWKKVDTLQNGIWVYENPKAIVPVPAAVPPSSPLASFSWGVFPLLAFVSAASLGTLRVFPVQAEWVLRKLYAFAISLLPLSLCFWLYGTVGDFSHPRVYFTYDNALFFLSDAIALLAVVLWIAVKVSKTSQLKFAHYRKAFEHDKTLFLLFSFFLFATLSTLWSQDWRTSLYISLHFWLIFLLLLSLRDWYETWTVAIYGLCAALSVQLIIGFVEFSLQSTTFLEAWNMKWPGILDPSMQGASVVQLGTGFRLLRAYGTLPHPNILGGFVFLTLFGPASLFLASKKPNYPALLLLILGVMLIGLTFSRSAWLALLAFVLVLAWKSKMIGSKRLYLLIACIGMVFALTLYPLRDFVFTRVGNANVATETISTVGRSWLTEQAMRTIQRHPLTGVGIGSFLIKLSKEASQGAPIEPVHNVLLLVTSELGMFGLLLLLGLFISIAQNIARSKSPRAILAGASLAGFGVIALFDHYLLTIAPGRLMLGLALGLWSGQVAHES
jgi:O-antigen ligase